MESKEVKVELGPKEVTPVKELSLEELGNLLSAVGNNEAKAVTLLVMRSGVIYTRPDLFRTVVETQGSLPGWVFNMSLPFDYCEYSLAPIGFVTKEVLDPNLGTYGYIKTDRGEKLGMPLVGLLLKFSQKYPGHALVDFFASTVSSTSKSQEIATVTGETTEFRKRSPVFNLKIFRGLISAPDLPIREADLMQRIGESHHSIVGEHFF